MHLKLKLPHLPHPPNILIDLFLLLFILAFCVASFFLLQTSQNIKQYIKQNQDLTASLTKLTQEYETLQNEDQRQKNLELAEELKQIKDTYKDSISAYEMLQDLKILTKNSTKLDETYAQIVSYLSLANYSSASAQLISLNKELLAQKQKATTPPAVSTTNLPQSNTPPSSGYSRQNVTTDAGTFVVSLISADLNSTRIIVDTASDSDCGNDCPVLPLAAYVARNGAYAGVNGSYFCPATYPSCVGKTNTFDLLVMNKNKHYFNSDNNVYSSNPAVIFGSGYIRFVSAASSWGRDTGIDSMLSNYPLLVEGGNLRLDGDTDPKKVSRGNRSFVANKGNQVFIGVVHSASVAESAQVMHALGMENALNLDDGGSTALWSSGYKVGPGRDLPNVILFVRK